MPVATRYAAGRRRTFPGSRPAILAALAAILSGCSQQPDTSVFLQHVQRHCVRSDAAHNPVAMPQHELRRVLGAADRIESVDPHTQRWTYRCADGDVALYVVLEPGGTWSSDAARVFVDPKRRDVAKAQRDDTRAAARW